MSENKDLQVEEHGATTHAGAKKQDREFLAEREQRSKLVEQFLAILARAEYPGSERTLGSTIRELTGQHSEHHWTTNVTDRPGHEREFVVFDDGRHGWADEMAYSDRPRNISDEPSVETVREALTAILVENNLSWS